MIDDPYDSNDENQLGIPAVLAMTSQMLNENILMSFFPAQGYGEQPMSDDDNRAEDYSDNGGVSSNMPQNQNMNPMMNGGNRYN